jgi:hypothetical protein
MTSRMSSGSSRTDSAVEPTRSENITVSWRRSAASATGGIGVAAAGAPLRDQQAPRRLQQALAVP